MNEEDIEYLVHSFYVDRMAESEAAALSTQTKEETLSISDIILAYALLEVFDTYVRFDTRQRIINNMTSIYDKVYRHIHETMIEFAIYEAKFTGRLFDPTKRVNEDEARLIATSTRINFNGNESFLADSVRQAIDYYNNSVNNIINMIETNKAAKIFERGDVTNDLARANKMLQTHLSGVIETYVTAIQASTLEKMVELNPRKFQNKYQWLSVLDSRTSETCRRRHGKIYTFGEAGSPKPPAHYRCRSRIKVLRQK